MVTIRIWLKNAELYYGNLGNNSNQYNQQDLHKEATHQQELVGLLSNPQTQNQIDTQRTNQVDPNSLMLNSVSHSKKVDLKLIKNEPSTSEKLKAFLIDIESYKTQLGGDPSLDEEEKEEKLEEKEQEIENKRLQATNRNQHAQQSHYAFVKHTIEGMIKLTEPIDHRQLKKDLCHLCHKSTVSELDQSLQQCLSNRSQTLGEFLQQLLNTKDAHHIDLANQLLIKYCDMTIHAGEQGNIKQLAQKDYLAAFQNIAQTLCTAIEQAQQHDQELSFLRMAFDSGSPCYEARADKILCYRPQKNDALLKPTDQEYLFLSQVFQQSKAPKKIQTHNITYQMSGMDFIDAAYTLFEKYQIRRYVANLPENHNKNLSELVTNDDLMSQTRTSKSYLCSPLNNDLIAFKDFLIDLFVHYLKYSNKEEAIKEIDTLLNQWLHQNIMDGFRDGNLGIRVLARQRENDQHPRIGGGIGPELQRLTHPKNLGDIPYSCVTVLQKGKSFPHYSTGAWADCSGVFLLDTNQSPPILAQGKVDFGSDRHWPIFNSTSYKQDFKTSSLKPKALNEQYGIRFNGQYADRTHFNDKFKEMDLRQKESMDKSPYGSTKYHLYEYLSKNNLFTLTNDQELEEKVDDQQSRRIGDETIQKWIVKIKQDKQLDKVRQKDFLQALENKLQDQTPEARYQYFARTETESAQLKYIDPLDFRRNERLLYMNNLRYSAIYVRYTPEGIEQAKAIYQCLNHRTQLPYPLYTYDSHKGELVPLKLERLDSLKQQMEQFRDNILSKQINLEALLKLQQPNQDEEKNSGLSSNTNEIKIPILDKLALYITHTEAKTLDVELSKAIESKTQSGLTLLALSNASFKGWDWTQYKSFPTALLKVAIDSNKSQGERFQALFILRAMVSSSEKAAINVMQSLETHQLLSPMLAMITDDMQKDKIRTQSADLMLNLSVNNSNQTQIGQMLENKDYRALIEVIKDPKLSDRLRSNCAGLMRNLACNDNNQTQIGKALEKDDGYRALIEVIKDPKLSAQLRSDSACLMFNLAYKDNNNQTQIGQVLEDKDYRALIEVIKDPKLSDRLRSNCAGLMRNLACNDNNQTQIGKVLKEGGYYKSLLNIIKDSNQSDRLRFNCVGLMHNLAYNDNNKTQIGKALEDEDYRALIEVIKDPKLNDRLRSNYAALMRSLAYNDNNKTQIGKALEDEDYRALIEVIKDPKLSDKFRLNCAILMQNLAINANNKILIGQVLEKVDGYCALIEVIKDPKLSDRLRFNCAVLMRNLAYNDNNKMQIGKALEDEDYRALIEVIKDPKLSDELRFNCAGFMCNLTCNDNNKTQIGQVLKKVDGYCALIEVIKDPKLSGELRSNCAVLMHNLAFNANNRMQIGKVLKKVDGYCALIEVIKDPKLSDELRSYCAGFMCNLTCNDNNKTQIGQVLKKVDGYCALIEVIKDPKLSDKFRLNCIGLMNSLMVQNNDNKSFVRGLSIYDDFKLYLLTQIDSKNKINSRLRSRFESLLNALESESNRCVIF